MKILRDFWSNRDVAEDVMLAVLIAIICLSWMGYLASLSAGS